MKDKEYEKYEKDCKKIKKNNEKLMGYFILYLDEANKSEKTIEKHLYNVDFYINDFLLYYEAVPANKGYNCLMDFFGGFFIRKCMWSTPASMKVFITSLKQFYTCMHKIGEITQEELKDVTSTIKLFKSEWIEAVEDYNNQDFDW